MSRQSYPERAKRNNGQGAVSPYCLWQGTVGGRRFAKRASGVEAERVEEEIAQRHLFEAKRVVIITDGAEWIKNIVQTHFPNSIHIIDLYHAREHLVDLCKRLFYRDLRRLNQYKDRWWDDLDEGKIETIVEHARSFLPKACLSAPASSKPDAKPSSAID